MTQPQLNVSVVNYGASSSQTFQFNQTLHFLSFHISRSNDVQPPSLMLPGDKTPSPMLLPSSESSVETLRACLFIEICSFLYVPEKNQKGHSRTANHEDQSGLTG